MSHQASFLTPAPISTVPPTPMKRRPTPLRPPRSPEAKTMAEWAKKARTCESPAAKKSLFHAMPASNKRAIQDAVAAQEIAKKAKLEPSPYETLFRTVSDTKTL